MINARQEAIEVITLHTKGYMQGMNYQPKTVEQFYDTMTEECASILVEDWLRGKYSALEFNAIRNELAAILYSAFVNKEVSA